MEGLVAYCRNAFGQRQLGYVVGVGEAFAGNDFDAVRQDNIARGVVPVVYGVAVDAQKLAVLHFIALIQTVDNYLRLPDGIAFKKAHAGRDIKGRKIVQTESSGPYHTQRLRKGHGRQQAEVVKSISVDMLHAFGNGV